MALERDDAPPPVTVKRVEPVCVCCGGTRRLILGDGPAVCRDCIVDAGVMGRATVRRNDTRDGNEPRDGQWR